MNITDDFKDTLDSFLELSKEIDVIELWNIIKIIRMEKGEKHHTESCMMMFCGTSKWACMDKLSGGYIDLNIGKCGFIFEDFYF
jgi:hypothetical protein